MDSRSSEAYPRFRFVILGYLGMANIMAVLIIVSIGILLPSISRDLGLSPSEQGLLGASVVFGNLLFALPSSLWLSRFRAKIVLAAVMLSASLMLLLQAWAPVFALLLLGRVLFGIAVVGRQPARAMLTTQWFPPKEYMIASGVIINFAFGIASVMALVLTPFLLIWLDDSWRATLTIYAVVFMLVAISWVLVGREKAGIGRRDVPSIEGPSPLRGILRFRQMWFLFAGIMGVSIMSNALVTFWPTLMLESHEIPLTTSGAILAADGVAEAIGAVTLALFLVRTSSRGVRMAILGIMAVLQAGAAIGMILNGSVPLLLVMAILHGIGYSATPIVFTAPFELPGITQREIAVAAGIIETAVRSGGVIGSLTAGFLQEATGNLELSLVATSCAVLSLFIPAVMVFGRRQRATMTAQAPTS